MKLSYGKAFCPLQHNSQNHHNTRAVLQNPAVIARKALCIYIFYLFHNNSAMGLYDVKDLIFFRIFSVSTFLSSFLYKFRVISKESRIVLLFQMIWSSCAKFLGHFKYSRNIRPITNHAQIRRSRVSPAAPIDTVHPSRIQHQNGFRFYISLSLFPEIAKLVVLKTQRIIFEIETNRRITRSDSDANKRNSVLHRACH